MIGEAFQGNLTEDSQSHLAHIKSATSFKTSKCRRIGKRHLLQTYCSKPAREYFAEVVFQDLRVGSIRLDFCLLIRFVA